MLCKSYSHAVFEVNKESRVGFHILAVGIPHKLQVANLPCLSASSAQFPRSTYPRSGTSIMLDNWVECPNGEIQLDCPGSVFQSSFSGSCGYSLPSRTPLPSRPSVQTSFESVCLQRLCRLLRPFHVTDQFHWIVFDPFAENCIKNPDEFSAQGNDGLHLGQRVSLAL